MASWGKCHDASWRDCHSIIRLRIISRHEKINASYIWIHTFSTLIMLWHFFGASTVNVKLVGCLTWVVWSFLLPTICFHWYAASCGCAGLCERGLVWQHSISCKGRPLALSTAILPGGWQAVLTLFLAIFECIAFILSNLCWLNC